MAEEATIYEHENIKITNLRAVFGEKTYSVANITSVEKKTIDRKGCAPLGLIVLGVLFMIAGGTSHLDSRFTTIGIGVIVFFLGVFAHNQAKPMYGVSLVTAGGEVRALESADEAAIMKVVDALNTAIVNKG